MLGKETTNWLDPGWVLWSERRGYVGVQDEDALAAALRELEAVRQLALIGDC